MPRFAHYLAVLAFCWVGLAPVGARAPALAGTFAEGFEHARRSPADGPWWAVGDNEYGQPGSSGEPDQLKPTPTGPNTDRGQVVA